MPFTAQLDSNNINSIEQTREIIAREIISATHETPVKEKISFDQDKNTLLLGVDKNALDLRGIEEMANKHGLDRKSEY